MSQQSELNFIGKVCARCGEIPGHLTEINGEFLCEKCYHENYFRCNQCHQYKSVKEKLSIRISSGYGKIVCQKCFEEYYSKCEHCGYGCRKSDIRIWEGHNYCNVCYDQMFVCVGCGIRHFREQYYDAGLCRKCWEEERHVINPDHLAKAPLEFQGKGPHFYGIELEVEVDERLDRRPSYAKKVLKVFGNFVITKHDGSIKDKSGRIIGFEIVTVPASKEVQFEKWAQFFDQPIKGMRSFDTKTCGLHIHCSRKPLSPLTIAKMLVFVNTKENVPFINTIAGRSPNQFCKIQDKVYKDARRPQDRYEALNLTNKSTVEFRIFRGTLKKESLFKSLEFCDALIHFCKECCYSIKDCRQVDKFTEYVKIHKKDYPHLWAFICARWLRVETDLTKKMGFPLPDKPAEVEDYNNEPNPQRRADDCDFDYNLDNYGYNRNRN